jgi:hypothetical protein
VIFPAADAIRSAPGSRKNECATTGATPMTPTILVLITLVLFVALDAALNDFRQS